MAPLVRLLASDPRHEHVLCISGQHVQMLAPVLSLFDLVPDHTLITMQEGQTLNSLTSRILTSVEAVLEEYEPEVLIVHGDTTTAMASALSAFHRKVKVAHVEAGLRTGDLHQPFPEEMNRRTIDSFSDFLFAPTVTAQRNLLRENLPGKVWVTGNTVIDALQWVCQKLDDQPTLAASIENQFAFLDPTRKLILVTGHRRENFGDGFKDICNALAELAHDPRVQIVYPVHLNPNVREAVHTALDMTPHVHLLPPVDYLTFVWLMRQAFVILTDSGGVQEEAPHLKKPVLVMRNVTERPEAIENGTAKLVGTATDNIVAEVKRLLDSSLYYESFCSSTNPYGDGHASERIANALAGNGLDDPLVTEAAEPSLIQG